MPGYQVRSCNPHELALIPGTRLGPYEVTAQIGVGGMGEVYKATDTNLKRAVAIKVFQLPTPKESVGDSAGRRSNGSAGIALLSVIS